MATQKQIEANRKNAQKSTGPRTEAGKQIARLNALRHGMRSEEFHLLPSENPAEFAERLDTWHRDYTPANEAEHQLVTLAATLSWRIDRASRHEHALLSARVGDAVAEAKHERDLRQNDAARRLIPTTEYLERSFFDSVPPDRLMAELEATDDGCRWLCDHWLKLGHAASQGTPWTQYQEMTALRLLGQGPATIRDPKVLELIVAARMLRAEESAPVDPDSWDGGGPLARLAVDRGAAWSAWGNRPADRAGALMVLAYVAAREVARLERLEADRRDGFDAELAEAADLASFDPTPEGERVRRYLDSLQRQLLKTIELIGKTRLQAVKLRLDEAKLQRMTSEANSVLGVDPGDLRSWVSAGSGDPRRADVGPLSGSNNEDANARQDDERTQSRNEEKEFMPPAGQETGTRQETNEASLEAGAHQIARLRRESWPLETLKRRRKAERKARRQTQAGGSKR